MTAIEDRKIKPVQPSKTTVNSLDDACALFQKQKVKPSKNSIKHAHEKSDKPTARLGQIIDILV